MFDATFTNATFTNLTVRRDTAGATEDMLTLDSVDRSDGNGAALRFINNSMADGLFLALGRLSVERVDSATVRMDLGVVSDPSLSTGEDTSTLLSLVSDAKKGLSITTAAASRFAVGGTLKVAGAATLSGNATIRGNLGVGTSDPTNRLHVFNTGPGLTIDGDQFPGFRMAVNGATIAMAQIRTDEGTSLDFGTYGQSPLYFLTNSVRRMSIGANGTIGLGLAGDVGIGTHLPKRRLHILQEGADPIDVLYLEHTGGTASMMFAPNSTESWRIGQGISVGGHAFELYDVASARTRLVIDAKGNVGVGNLAPTAMLHVAGHMAVGPFSSGMTGGGIEVTGPAAEVTFMRRSLTSWPAAPVAGDRFSWYNPDGTARLWTDRSGDVMTIDINGNLTMRGKVLQPSSRQLKEHIVPIADALAKVAQLQGVSFTWKSDRDRDREIGFIAEDVGAVVPELVDTGNPGFLSYDRIAVLAVQAIKELSQQVADLSQKVMLLERRM